MMIRSVKSVSTISRVSHARQLSYISPAEQWSIPFKTEPQAPAARAAKTSTLANGVKISTKGDIAPIATVKFTIAAGSGYESPSAKGAAHYLSKLGLAGTENFTGLRIARDLETSGAKFEMTADRENITITVKSLAEKVEDVFAVVAEIITSPPKHRHVITEAKEIVQVSYNQLKSSPMKQLEELVHETAFGEVSPLGASLYAENINYVQPNEILAFRSKQFLSGNVSIAANGIAHESLIALAEGYIREELPTGSSDSLAANYTGGELKVRTDLGGSTYSAVAFPVSTKSAGAYGVIFQQLSKKIKESNLPKGALTPFYTPYTNGGLFGLYAGNCSSSVAAHLQVGIEELKSIASGKADLSASIKKASLETASSNDRVSVLSESSSAAVAKDAVAKAAAEMLSAKPTYVILGKTAGTPSYASVSSWAK